MLRVFVRSFAKFRPDLTSAELLSPDGPRPALSSSSGAPYYDRAKLEKLQKLVTMHTVTPGLSIPNTLLELAKKDEEFSDFLKSFSEKTEPKYSSILDEGYGKSFLEEDLKRSKEERLKELHMFEHYRKAKIVSQVKEKMMKEARKKTPYREFVELKGKRLFPDAFFKREDFHLLLLEVGSTTNITRLARVMKRRCLVFAGNKDGIIGYGKGKGVDYRGAFRHAVRECINNLIAVPLDQIARNLVYLRGSHNSTYLEIIPRHSGAMWGNPVVVSMLELTGVTDCSFFLKGRNRYLHSIVYSFFEAVTQNITPRQLAEQSGRKVYDITYGFHKQP